MNATQLILPSEAAPVASVDAESFESTDVDEVASHFLEIEARAASAYDRAAKAYDHAWTLDQPVEHLRERLMKLAAKFGAANGADSKFLRGREFKIELRLAPSRFLDHQAITRFRYALITEKREAVRGRLEEVFTGRMIYEFMPGAAELLKGMKLSTELRRLYRECWPVQKTPILLVSAISTTRPVAE